MVPKLKKILKIGELCLKLVKLMVFTQNPKKNGFVNFEPQPHKSWRTCWTSSTGAVPWPSAWRTASSAPCVSSRPGGSSTSATGTAATLHNTCLYFKTISPYSSIFPFSPATVSFFISFNFFILFFPSLSLLPTPIHLSSFPLVHSSLIVPRIPGATSCAWPVGGVSGAALSVELPSPCPPSGK